MQVFAIFYLLFPLLSLFAGVIAQEPCNLDDVQSTPGNCITIKACKYAIGQLYAGGPVKRCGASTDRICCPSESTLSQKKCQEYKDILKVPHTFGQSPYSTPRCAHSSPPAFIVGGRDAHEFEFPHAVGLGYGTDPNRLEYSCGATLISDQYLLTAAHCLNNAKKGKPQYAVIGDVTLHHSTSVYRKQVRIVDWIMHPAYKPPLIYNDIALLKLESRLELSRYLLPACLGDPVVTPKNDGQVQAIGWGQLSFQGGQATTLQAVQLEVIPSKKCNDEYSDAGEKGVRYPEGYRKTQFCAGDISGQGEESKDTCNGDSGGGVVVNPEVPCLFHVVGLTSTGSKFCGYGDPGIYTKVASYLDWIERIVWA